MSFSKCHYTVKTQWCSHNADHNMNIHCCEDLRSYKMGELHELERGNYILQKSNYCSNTIQK